MGTCRSRTARSADRPELSAARRKVLRELFRSSVRRLVHLLRIRRRWAAIGLALQEPRTVALFDGLVRLKGVLTRPKAGRRR